MDTLAHFLKSNTEGDLVPWSTAEKAVEDFNLSHHEVEENILRLNLLPKRYQRNRNTIQIEQQKILFNSMAAVAGCGGLGGYITEELARIGIGHITVIDPDVFEEHNLNRQLFSSIDLLGRLKTEVAAERIHDINPAVEVKSVSAAFSKENGRDLLKGADIVIDALDSIETMFELAEVCRLLDIPLVHGSAAGWFGQIAVQFPGEEILPRIYRDKLKKGVEEELGNVSFGPAVIAGLEVAETAKLLLNRTSRLRGKLLVVDLLEMQFTEISLDMD